MKLFTDEQYNQIGDLEVFGNRIVTVFNLKPTPHTKDKGRKEYYTDFGEKSSLGIARTILNLVEQHIN